VTEWTRLLDVLERQLSKQHNSFRHGEEPPKGLMLDRPEVPMTTSESIRAADLMQRTDALLTQTVDALRAQRRLADSPYS